MILQMLLRMETAMSLSVLSFYKHKLLCSKMTETVMETVGRCSARYEVSLTGQPVVVSEAARRTEDILILATARLFLLTVTKVLGHYAAYPTIFVVRVIQQPQLRMKLPHLFGVTAVAV